MDTTFASKFAAQFEGKVALVTGASFGIGKATALAFAQRGAHVVVADVNPEGESTCRMVRDLGKKSIFIRCDVSNSKEVETLVGRTVSEFGRLDFAFNNAGIEGDQALTSLSDEANWDRVLNVNLKGVWLCMKFELQQMLKQGSGSIVNCSSIAGLVGFPGISPYVASKHGVLGLTKTAALEYAKSNIRINAVCPGVIQTPMIDRFAHGEAQTLKQLANGEPVGRIGQPEEIATAVTWLCSTEASFITGHPLVVDGGWVAQ